MKTDFFRKQIFALAGILSAAVVLSGVFYAHVLTKTEVVDLTRSFYFLVSEEENAPASAENIYLDGGAGYVMSRGERDYAVISCYFNEPDAKAVKNNLDRKQIASSVLEERGGRLYLQTRSEKRNAQRLAGCFRTLDGCISLLYDIANGAERGTYTQQALKRSLSAVKGVLSCLSEENRGGMFTDISACAARASEKIGELSQGIIYAKDVRYVQVYLSDSYLLLASRFSL